MTSRLPEVMERLYPPANSPVTVNVAEPDALPAMVVSPTTRKRPWVLVMVMFCPTARVGAYWWVLAAPGPGVDCVAAKTGVSAPDIVRSAAKIPATAPIVASFVLVVFMSVSSFSHGALESIYWEGTVRPYAAYVRRVHDDEILREESVVT